MEPAAASLAELSGRLLRARGFGVLSTLSKRALGHPFGSVVTYAVDSDGSPIFLLSRLAVHTTNLLANPKASLLVFAHEIESQPLNTPRVTIFGEVTALQEADVRDMRASYLARHPESDQWIHFGDFSFYRMLLAEAYYVGGFGVMGWVDGVDLAAH